LRQSSKNKNRSLEKKIPRGPRAGFFVSGLARYLKPGRTKTPQRPVLTFPGCESSNSMPGMPHQAKPRAARLRLVNFF
jgi:hypothetical protein